MKYSITLSCAILMAIFFLGCIESETVITIKPDGSGTLQETFLMSKVASRQMASMFGSMTEETGDDTIATIGSVSGFDFYKEDELREKAKNMGEGVEFVSGKPFETDKAEGFKVTYSFQDINNLIINQNPGECVPSAGETSKKNVVKENVTFKFSRGKVSTLTIKSPRSKDDEAQKDKSTTDPVKNSAADMPEAGLEQVKQMFDGMRVAMIVKIDGNIIKTNATHVDGNRITVMDMDFGKLLEAPEAFKKFAQINPKTVEDAKKLVKNVPGIKVDLNEKIEVRFK